MRKDTEIEIKQGYKNVGAAEVSEGEREGGENGKDSGRDVR